MGLMGPIWGFDMPPPIPQPTPQQQPPQQGTHYALGNDRMKTIRPYASAGTHVAEQHREGNVPTMERVFASAAPFTQKFARTLGDIFNYGGSSMMGRMAHYNNTHPAQALSQVQFAKFMNRFAWRAGQAEAAQAAMVLGPTINGPRQAATYAIVAGATAAANPTATLDFVEQATGLSDGPPMSNAALAGWGVRQAYSFDPNDLPMYKDYYYGQ